jgi:hypothetical protein
VNSLTSPQEKEEKIQFLISILEQHALTRPSFVKQCILFIDMKQTRSNIILVLNEPYELVAISL